MWSKNKSLCLSTVIVKLVFLVLIITVFIIPVLVKWYVSQYGNEDVLIPLCVTLYASLFPAFGAIIALNKLLSNIKKDQVFIHQNVTILRCISWCCYVVTIIFFIFGFFRPLSFLISFAAAFFGLILRVLKNVFEQAVTMREENDYTI